MRYLKQAYAEVLLETAPSFDYDRAWHRVAERAKERKGKPMSVTVKPEIDLGSRLAVAAAPVQHGGGDDRIPLRREPPRSRDSLRRADISTA
ncbi:hypothetical protein QRB38_11940 [Mycobacterium avium subsp. hominissuis]|nr:hypothetical protein [Mycobacterium avium subsp. hominissuis]